MMTLEKIEKEFHRQNLMKSVMPVEDFKKEIIEYFNCLAEGHHLKTKIKDCNLLDNGIELFAENDVMPFLQVLKKLDTKITILLNLFIKGGV